MEKFQYNNQTTDESNFKQWFILNYDERNSFGLKAYSRKEARQVFDDIHSNKIAHSFKINKNGVLEDVLVVED